MGHSQGLNQLIPIHKRFKAFFNELLQLTGLSASEICPTKEMLDFVNSGFKYYVNVNQLNARYNSNLQKEYLAGGPDHVIYAADREMPDDMMFTTNCKELLLSWIPKQHSIYGCQMFLQDRDVLRLLAEVDKVCLVVNHNDWMDSRSRC